MNSTMDDQAVPRLVSWPVTVFAAGLLAVGVSLMFPMSPAVPELPGWLAWYAAIPGITLVSVIGAGLRARANPNPTPLGPSPLRQFRARCGFLAVSAGWPTVWAWWLTVENFSGGLPGLTPVLFAIGCSAGMVGAAGLTVYGMRTAARPDRARPRLIVAVTCVLVMVAAIGATAVLVNAVTIDASTATATKAAPPPHNPTAAAWDWEAPDGNRVQEVVAAGAGVVALLDDGVVALDGKSGEKRWHFRLDGAEAVDLGAGLDGGTVMVTFESSIADAKGTRVVGLDAMTGERTGFDELVQPSPSGGLELDMTEHVLIDGDYRSDEYRGLDLRTGQTRWTWSSPDTCDVGDLGDNPKLARDVVLLGLICWPEKPTGSKVTPTATLLALDDRTGEERWRFERELPAATPSDDPKYNPYWMSLHWRFHKELDVSVDGSTVGFGWFDNDSDKRGWFLVDDKTGSLLLEKADVPRDEFIAFDRERLVTKTHKPVEYTVTALDETAETEARIDPETEPTVLTDKALIGVVPDDRSDRYRGVLVVTPWSGKDATEFDIDLGKPVGQRTAVNINLTLAPGAVVAWNSGAPRISAIA